MIIAIQSRNCPPFSHGQAPLKSGTLKNHLFQDPQSVSSELKKGYRDLMSRAPGAAFRRARALYLNKYPLPQDGCDLPLRLFIASEQLQEELHPAPDGEPGHRLATLTSRPGQLALVHWKHNDPAPLDLVTHYLRTAWNLRLDSLDLHAQAEPWFRESGHQSLFSSPCELVFRRETLLTLRE